MLLDRKLLVVNKYKLQSYEACTPMANLQLVALDRSNCNYHLIEVVKLHSNGISYFSRAIAQSNSLTYMNHLKELRDKL
jgi:hypothetical protein